MIEGIFFALDIFFAVALVYWIYAADSSLEENPGGLFRWAQHTTDQKKHPGEHNLSEQRRDLGKN